MPRRKQAKRTTVKDLRSILRLTYEQNLSVRAISERLHISKTSVSTYLLRARGAGVTWPLLAVYENEAALQRALFRRMGLTFASSSPPRRIDAVQASLPWRPLDVCELNVGLSCCRFDGHRD